MAKHKIAKRTNKQSVIEVFAYLPHAFWREVSARLRSICISALTVAPRQQHSGMTLWLKVLSARLSKLRVTKNYWSRAGGFSLLEILVVLLLISMITGLLLPQFSKSLITYTGRSSVRKVAAMLRYARSQAVSKQTIHWVEIDYPGQRLAFFADKKKEGADSLLGGGQDLSEKEDKEPAYLLYEMPEKIKLMAPDSFLAGEAVDPSSVIFYPNGTSSARELAFADSRAGRYLIKVDLLTGSVRIE